ncbi:hypothetical protein ACCW76_18455 [Pantoea sp. C8B4]|uniref:hypothetical protein n=1 Tax=Pantoea sp. C8B4 TaxID=3243083 RepID=UPI003ED880CB
MCNLSLSPFTLLSTLFTAHHNGFDDNSGFIRTTDYVANYSFNAGYENFIFAVPDKNISDAEAKSHRLDTEKHHPTLRELKKGRSKQTKENGTSHWNDYAV